jgi:hypothetical protein
MIIQLQFSEIMGVNLDSYRYLFAILKKIMFIYNGIT